MAVVDFSNAIITPIGYQSVIYEWNIIYLYLDGGIFKDENGSIIANATRTRMIDQQNQFLNVYTGTFTASGTEFYIMHTVTSSGIDYGWKISNISFQSGDTFVLKIKATLTYQ